MPDHKVDDLKLEEEGAWRQRLPIGGKTVREADMMKRREEAGAYREIESPDDHGAFEERGAAAARSLVKPLFLSREALQHAGANLTAYKASYNQYVEPMRQTLRSMGRLKDLQRAGAPLTPEAFQAEHAGAARNFDERRGRGAVSEFDSWSKAQSDLKRSVGEVTSATGQLQAAKANFDGVQAKLQSRALDAQRDGKLGQVARIEQAAQTLVRIVNVSQEAWNAAGLLESLSSAPAPADTSEAGAAADHRATSVARGVREVYGNADVKAIRESVMKSSSFSLEEIFIYAMGEQGKYQQLKQDIAELTSQMIELDYRAESKEIEEAEKRLESYQLGLKIEKYGVSIERRAARRGADRFADEMGGSEGVQLAMYAAEAYQEATIFGEHAEEMRRPVDDWWASVASYTARYKLSYEAKGWWEDWHALRDNVAGVKGQRDLLNAKLPEWKDRADAWESYVAGAVPKRDELMIEDDLDG